jgi:hypothetical protein
MFVINVCELGLGDKWHHSELIRRELTQNTINYLPNWLYFGHNVSTYPTMDSTAPLEKLNMIFDSHLGILYTTEPDYTCARSNNACC